MTDLAKYLAIADASSESDGQDSPSIRPIKLDTRSCALFPRKDKIDRGSGRIRSLSLRFSNLAADCTSSASMRHVVLRSLSTKSSASIELMIVGSEP